MTAQLPEEPVEVVENESFEFGRLWPDGTFQSFGGWSSETTARKTMDEKSYELREVPESLRPVLGRQRIVSTKKLFAPEPLPAVTK